MADITCSLVAIEENEYHHAERVYVLKQRRLWW